jgi:hypothetical protein
MSDLIKIPPQWMGDAREAYDQYCNEWVREEAERVHGTDESPDPVQSWPEFFAEYLYAELESCVGVGDPRACQ